METGVPILAGSMKNQSHNICVSCPFVHTCFYAPPPTPNVEETERAYWFGPFRDMILKFNIWNVHKN